MPEDIDPFAGGAYSYGKEVASGSVLAEGTRLNVTALPDEKYEIRQWNGSISGAAASFVLTMDADKSLWLTLSPKKGSMFTIDNLLYKITNTGINGEGTVELVDADKHYKGKSLIVPGQVQIGGYTYKVTSIGKKAFFKNRTLRKVKINGPVKVIGKSAFRQCKNLKQVTIGDNVEIIKSFAFYSCKKLTKVTIGKKVVLWGLHVFCCNPKLKTVTIKSKMLKAVSGIHFHGHENIVLKVPKSCLKKYKKIFRRAVKGNIKKWVGI